MGAKRLTTLETYTGLTAAPASDLDILVDGCVAELGINIFDIAGTSPQIACTIVERISKEWSLPYDGQTANFTVGATVTGYAFDGGENASGIIMNDTDGGATGTLLLSTVAGKFKDNMILRDDNATQGVALVNSVTGGVRVWAEGQTWATIALGAVDVSAQLLNPNLSSGDGDMTKVFPRYFRVKFTDSGTITNLDMSIDLLQVL